MSPANTASNQDLNRPNELTVCQSLSTVIVDLVSFLIVFIVSLLFAFNTFDLKPFDRGFFCDDQSLMYPYKDDTISTLSAAAIAILIFPIVVIFVEPIYIFTCMRNENDSLGIRKIAINTGRSLYLLIRMFLLGGALTLSVVSMVKLSAGRLRPNFISWCSPDYNVSHCQVGGGYISDFVCTNNDTDAVDDSKQSFPSGHSASAFYAFPYVAIYLDIRLRQQLKWQLYFRVIAPTVQILLLIAALYICLSRIQDNKHHPTDVLGGAAFGLVFCLITIFIWSREDMFGTTAEIPEQGQLPTLTRASFRTSPNNVNGSQNPIMQSSYSIDNAGQENVTFDVPSSPL